MDGNAKAEFVACAATPGASPTGCTRQQLRRQHQPRPTRYKEKNHMLGI
jgi:hypothetical protein